MAAFVLAAITDDHAKGQAVVAGSGLMPICLNHLPHAASPAGSPLFVRWLCLCLGKLWDNFHSLQVGLDTTFHHVILQSKHQPSYEQIVSPSNRGTSLVRTY
jgi:regulator-associated protein of mTOR